MSGCLTPGLPRGKKKEEVRVNDTSLTCTKSRGEPARISGKRQFAGETTPPSIIKEIL